MDRSKLITATLEAGKHCARCKGDMSSAGTEVQGIKDRHRGIIETENRVPVVMHVPSLAV